MGSGIITKIRLEPFYQQFLKGYYHEFDIPFKFPREDADELHLAVKFNNMLMPSPPGYKNQNFGIYEFLIEVPYQKEKDPFFYNYISLRRNTIFAERIEMAYKYHFHEEMMKLRNLGYTYKNCVELFMDELHIDAEYYDRCIKDFQRWKNAVSVKKYRQKISKIA
jgi:hypothetical protein